MAAATSWAELAQSPGYIATAARNKGVPEYGIEDVVGDAVLEALERSAKGQRFPGQATATKGLVGSAVRRAMRQLRQPEREMSNRPTLDPEDEVTRAQLEEWAALSERERLERVREARIATQTSISLATAGAGRPGWYRNRQR